MKYLKPKMGAPCNGCGMCCINSICAAGVALMYGDTSDSERPGPCPALQPRPDGSFACGVMVDPAKYAPRHTERFGVEVVRDAMMFVNGAGTPGRGCDAYLPEVDHPLRQWLHRMQTMEWAHRIPKDRWKQLHDVFFSGAVAP